MTEQTEKPEKNYDANRVQFRAQPDMLAQLASRAKEGYGEGPGAVAARDLARYYALLDRARRVLRSEAGGLDPFTPEELSLIADAGNGTIWEPPMFGALSLQIADAIRLDGLDRKWGVDGSALMDKINTLSDLEEWALIDAVERWWQDESRGEPGGLLG